MNSNNNEKSVNHKGGSYVEYEPVDEKQLHCTFGGIIKPSDYSYVYYYSAPRYLSEEAEYLSYIDRVNIKLIKQKMDTNKFGTRPFN